MDGILALQMSLLRGESPSLIDLKSCGRPGALRMAIQKKGALSDRLAMDLLALIADGTLPPGTRLPPERRIAESLSASRVSIRSALDRLKSEGYLTSVQGSGTRVAEGGDQLDALLRANRENLQDLGEFCAFLDGALVGAALDTCDEPALLAARVAEALPKGRDAAERARGEMMLRQTLANASGSGVYPLLIDCLQRGLRSYFEAMFAGFPSGASLTSLSRSGTDLVAAISRGDRETALAAMAVRTELFRAPPFWPAGRKAPCGEQLLRDLSTRQPETLRDSVAREIAQMIASGHIERGDRILSERRLADLFGISRVTVREALSKLKSEGVVVSAERFGTHAALDQLADDLAEAACESVASFRDLCGLRYHLEVWAARRAATRATDGDLQDLRRILCEMRRPIRCPRRAIDLDLNLHLTIARAAGSALHLFVAEVLRGLVTGYFNHSLTDPSIAGGREHILLVQHAEIVEAITARDPEAAARAMDRHVRSFRESYDTGRAIEHVRPAASASQQPVPGTVH